MPSIQALWFKGYSSALNEKLDDLYARKIVIFTCTLLAPLGAQKAICLLSKYLQRLTMREIVEKAIILEDCFLAI